MSRTALLTIAVFAAGLAACGGGAKEKPVASVAGHPISREQLDQTIEHFQEEAKNEGRLFPKKGSRQYGSVEKRLLALLVYRKELELAAARLGVRVSDRQVESRLAKSGGTAEKDDAFLRGTARSQLVLEAVTRKLTRNLHVTAVEVRSYYTAHRQAYGKTPFAQLRGSIERQLLAQRKNDATARWIGQAQRTLGPKVRYALKD